MGPTEREAKKQMEDKRLREKHLGKPSLKHRLKEYLKGSHNYTVNDSGRGISKTLAEEKEQTKLARLMEERKKNGEYEKTKARRKK